MSRVEAAAPALGETTEIGQTGAPQGMGARAGFWGRPSDVYNSTTPPGTVTSLEP